MSGLLVGGLGFAGMLLLIALRMPVGLAMLVAGSIGYVHLQGWGIFLNYIKSTPYYLFSNYTLSVIPLFVLMGAFAERGGQSTNLFRAASALVGRVRGGLAMAVVWAAAVFGAICGSSVATTATFGRAVLPELKRYGYEDGLATGTIAISGVLGILIPPSIIIVVYAISTEQNIVKLFQAALIPGLLAAVFYCIAIALYVRRNPGHAPSRAVPDGRERRLALLRVWPLAFVIALALGGIYGGIFTATEGRGRHARHAGGRAAAARAFLAGLPNQPHQYRRDRGDDLPHSAGSGSVQRLPGADAVAGEAGRARRRIGLSPMA